MTSIDYPPCDFTVGIKTLRNKYYIKLTVNKYSGEIKIIYRTAYKDNKKKKKIYDCGSWNYFDDGAIKHIPGVNIQIPEQITQFYTQYFGDYDQKRSDECAAQLIEYFENGHFVMTRRCNYTLDKIRRTFDFGNRIKEDDKTGKTGKTAIFVCDRNIHTGRKYICDWIDIWSADKIFAYYTDDTNYRNDQNFISCVNQYLTKKGIKEFTVIYVYPSIVSIIVEYFG